MKLFVFLASFFLFFSASAQQVKIMSYNIRLDVKSDGENQWEKRKEKLTGLLNYYEADFIGLQEVQHHQLQFIKQALPKYNHIGVGRDDGKTEGEHSCILYKKDRYSLMQQGTFWLSPTPAIVSFGWNAACRRVCTFGLFKDKSTGKLLWVFNTHMDHLGDTAREESAKLIVSKIQQLNKGYGYPVVLTGDFNARPESLPVQTIKTLLADARAIAKAQPYGPADTWNAFAFDKKPDGRIDYIFISQQSINVDKFATITDSYDLKYPSDHFPIMATISILKR